MLEQRDPDDTTVGERAGIIGPRRTFAPHRNAAIAGGVDQRAGAGTLVLVFPVRDAQRFVHAHGHRALLGVPEGDGTVRGAERDLVVEDGAGRGARDAERGFVGEQGPGVVRLPELAETQEADGTGAGFQNRVEDDTAGLLFGNFPPKIVAVDGAVGKPHTAVPVVIRNLGRVLFERKIARVARTVGVKDRVETRLGPAGVEVV